MKIAAVLVGLCSVAAVTAGVRLGLRTLAFATGPDYALEHDAAGSGTGHAIFFPSFLLLALGLFLAKFAWSLWKD